MLHFVVSLFYSVNRESVYLVISCFTGNDIEKIK